MKISELVKVVSGIVYPWPMRCVNCRGYTGSRHVLCPECLEQLAGQQVRTEFGGSDFGVSVAAHLYSGPGGALVRLLKYRAISELCREMADDMIAAANAAGMPMVDAVTHVPMHWMRRRRRYFDQAELLAREVAKAMGLEAEKLLIRSRSCRSQANISDDEKRRENVRDAFKAVNSVAGKSVLLIDDVYTTGATAQNCARALKAAGAKEVHILVYSISHSAEGVPLCEGPVIDDDELPF